jgi:hypothetical protein
MRHLVSLSLLLLPACGCGPWHRLPLRAAHGPIANPMLVPIRDPEYVWDKLLDVIDDHFVIEREERARWVGDVLVEGYLETRPLSGATLLEPWHHDSVTPYDRWESTLQTIRRRAIVRVIPDAAGYLVEVAVLKELEDLPRPQHASAGGSTFRYDESLERYREPATDQIGPRGWIPLGRDVALEQQLLDRFQASLGDGR